MQSKCSLMMGPAFCLGFVAAWIGWWRMAKDRQCSVRAWADLVPMSGYRLPYSLQLMLVWLWLLQQAITMMMHVLILQHVQQLL